MRNTIQMIGLVFFLVLPGLGHADELSLEAPMEQFVEQVVRIETDSAWLQLGDRSFNYTNFIIVQHYQRDPDQRLPLKSVTVGSWVLIDAEYSPELRTYIARRLQILPSAAVAKKVLESL
ncbi:hypothetical protein [Reinekea sp.]|uniref:hypothetical protein n=1 Tax=Reinekea sp. TaxID=1970455 RepID=UPI002A807E94|nr:hypothetical protein [Reinekea sp.]